MAKKKATSPKKKTKSSHGGAKRSPTLGALRRQIDALDRQLVKLANERAELAQEIAHLKDDAGAPRYSPRREEEIIQNVVARNEGPLSDESVRTLFRELVSGARSVVRPLRVSYLGPEYTYSHLAAIERFGQSAELVPVASIAAVFEEVERKQVEYGVVPIENSTDGRVTDTLERLAKTPVQICGEVQLRIHHHLLGAGPRGQIAEVYSKPQVLSQCRNWTAKHLPGARLIETASSAEAAQLAKTKPRAAALASRQAAVNHGLDILAENVEDNPHNLTRFAVIGFQTHERTGADKTAIVFEISHQPGALADAMAIFKRNRLNLTWIESFPIFGETGRYLFFVELVGHPADLRVRRALASLEKKAIRQVVLGSYACMEPVG